MLSLTLLNADDTMTRSVSSDNVSVKSTEIISYFFILIILMEIVIASNISFSMKIDLFHDSAYLTIPHPVSALEQLILPASLTPDVLLGWIAVKLCASTSRRHPQHPVYCDPVLTESCKEQGQQ